MSFKFEKEDDYGNLPGPIAAHMAKYVQNRYADYQTFVRDVEKRDFEAMRKYCHSVVGIAGSYKCFQLEEITRYVQAFAKSEDVDSIIAVLPIYTSYMEDLNSKF